MKHIKEHIDNYMNKMIRINEDSVFRYWYDECIDELRIKWAENGADREMDFDEDREIEKEYENYTNTLRK